MGLANFFSGPPMKVLHTFLALCLAVSLSANFKDAYNMCLQEPPRNIWLQADQYLRRGLPQEKIQDFLDEHTKCAVRLRGAYKSFETTEAELEDLRGQLERAIGVRRSLNRITLSSQLYKNDSYIEDKFGYLEEEHDEIEERIKGLQRTLTQCQQRLFFGQNIIASLRGQIDRYTCFVSALSGLSLRDFPDFAPEEDGLIVGWPLQVAISEPNFEFEAELREANYCLEAAELDLVFKDVHSFVDSSTDYLLICKIFGRANYAYPTYATLVNYEEWTEVIYGGVDLDKHTVGFSKKGWRILSERGKRQLRKIIRNQFLMAHQTGIYRLAVDMSYFAVNLVDPTTVLELYKLYSYLFAQVEFKSIHFCLPPSPILRKYFKHMQQYFERLAFRNDLDRSLRMQQVAEKQQIPVWKVLPDEEEDVILDDSDTEEDDDLAITKS